MRRRCAALSAQIAALPSFIVSQRVLREMVVRRDRQRNSDDAPPATPANPSEELLIVPKPIADTDLTQDERSILKR